LRNRIQTAPLLVPLSSSYIAPTTISSTPSLSRSPREETELPKLSTLSSIKDKYDKKIDDQVKEPIAPKKQIQQIEPPSKSIEITPRNIQEFDEIIKSTGSLERDEIEQETKAIIKELDDMDEEIVEIEDRVEVSAKKLMDQELTPFERALKFGVNLKDDEIFSESAKVEEQSSEFSLYDLIDRCPNCNSRISEKNLRLIFKGYKIECDVCGSNLEKNGLISK